jgi:carbonic anhydrase
MSEHTSPVMSAADALVRLRAGNERFVRGDARPMAVPHETLADLARGQRPFATILGCSDSRVPPEWVFDVGLGELFVVRVAGNVFSPEVAGSLQYAGAHLHTPLFVVMGHEGCGAVQAALAARHEGAQFRRHIQLLVDGIVPGVESIDPALPEAEKLARAVEANVRRTVRAILETPEGAAAAAEGRLTVVGAIYEIGTGRVNFLGG